MKPSKNDGFTLIELLVGINLAALTFTLILSFFLVISKFSNYFEKNLSSKKKTEYFFEMFRKELDKTPDITMNYINSSLQFSKCPSLFSANNNGGSWNNSAIPILTFGKDTIKLKDNILAPVKWEMEILTAKENISIKSNNRIDLTNELNLNGMKELTLKLIMNDHEYNYQYIKPELPVLNFENI